MKIKFYKINKPEDLHLCEQFLFKAIIPTVPRKGERIVTDDNSYQVVEVNYILYDDSDDYIKYSFDEAVVVVI